MNVSEVYQGQIGFGDVVNVIDTIPYRFKIISNVKIVLIKFHPFELYQSKIKDQGTYGEEAQHSRFENPVTKQGRF